MQNLWALPVQEEGASKAEGRVYTGAWVVVLMALLAGPAAASLDPLRKARWLLAASAAAIGGLGTISAILHRSLRRSEERRRAPGGALDSEAGIGGLRANRDRHDLVNLATIIAGYAESLLSQAGPDDPARKDLEGIEEAAGRAIGLLQRMKAGAVGAGGAGPVGAPVHAVSEGSEAEQGPGTVLVVDDEAAIRTFIRRSLTPRGWTVLEASNGEEALAEAATYDGKIDIAIIDFVLPGINGMDLALQMERSFPALKTLYVTGAGESVGMASILRHAPDRVLLKPFTSGQLADRVMTLAGNWE